MKKLGFSNSLVNFSDHPLSLEKQEEEKKEGGGAKGG